MGQWLLPETLATESICVKIEIPNTDQDIRNFLGQLLELSYFFEYEDDGTNKRYQVAALWQQAFADTLIGACMEIRIDPTDNCIVQSSSDGGETWTELYDMSDCVLSSIENNQLIRNAIASLSTSSNINSTSPENATNLAGELVNNPVGCDNDIIYGMTTQLVEFADRLIRDLLEGIKGSSLSSDNVGFLIGAIPVIETFPLDELFELGYKIANDMEVAYLSASTELLKTEIACELFCLAQDNDCVLTLEMVRDYFQEKADVVFDYSDPLAFIADFITGVFVGNAVYYGMNILLFQIFAFGGKFLEYFFEDYLRVINSMFNDPNADWLTECDDCPDSWSHTFDFSIDDGGFTAINGFGGARGTYATGSAWVTTDTEVSGGTFRRGMYLSKTITPDTVITSVSMNFNMTKGSFVGNPACQTLYQLLDTVVVTVNQVLASDAVSGNDQTLLMTLNETADEIRLVLTTSNQASASYSGSASLLSVTIQGSGTNPFI